MVITRWQSPRRDSVQHVGDRLRGCTMCVRTSYRYQRVLRQGARHCHQMVCHNVCQTCTVLHILEGVLNFCCPFHCQRGRGDPRHWDRLEPTHITQYLPISQLLLLQDLNRPILRASLHLQVNYLPTPHRSSPSPLQHPLFLIPILLFLHGKICVLLNPSWSWRKKTHSRLRGHVSKRATLFMPFTYWVPAEVPNPSFWMYILSLLWVFESNSVACEIIFSWRGAKRKLKETGIN